MDFPTSLLRTRSIERAKAKSFRAIQYWLLTYPGMERANEERSVQTLSANRRSHPYHHSSICGVMEQSWWNKCVSRTLIPAHRNELFPTQNESLHAVFANADGVGALPNHRATGPGPTTPMFAGQLQRSRRRIESSGRGQVVTVRSQRVVLFRALW